MQATRVALHSRFAVGAVDPRIFGGFLEHLGRAVYGGIFDPGGAHADADGCRTDVLEALRRLDMTVMRYPGGNFASGYRWTDGVGRREARPAMLDLAWQSIEPNEFGTDEFLALCAKMGWDAMLTVNLGTGTPEQARDWVEYANSPAGTRWADLRAESGRREPWGVKLWCLGNEMDGPWQLGHVPAAEYALRAQQAARLMKGCDRSIETVVCGSCTPDIDSYMEWDRQVMEYIGDGADYISLHRYVGNRDGDTPAYLAVSGSVDRQIEEMDAACRFVQARRRSARRPYLCFDEWNVWYRERGDDGRRTRAPHLLEERYNLEDAVVVAGFLASFVRHADVVRIANLAQVVNVIAPIITDGDRMLVQSIFHPFAMFSKRRAGVSLRVAVDGPSRRGKSSGEAALVDASAILGEGVLHVFLANRSDSQAAPVTIDPADFRLAGLASAEVLTGPGAKAENTWTKPDLVAAKPFAEVRVRDGTAALELPPQSPHRIAGAPRARGTPAPAGRPLPAGPPVTVSYRRLRPAGGACHGAASCSTIVAPSADGP
jgi:alpha-N-arabinofuranosidase